MDLSQSLISPITTTFTIPSPTYKKPRKVSKPPHILLTTTQEPKSSDNLRKLGLEGLLSPAYQLNFLDYPNIPPLDYINQKIKNDKLQDSFLVADLGQVIRSLNLWEQYLPRVKPFYAVKSNPDNVILKLMVRLNMAFDCASLKEIETILNLGMEPNNIIYANPCKQPNHIEFAKEHNVLKMTFDNLDELNKIHKLHPNAELILRILPLDKHSKVPFGAKFGAEVGPLTYELLKYAKELNLKVIGISFHVGSDCLEPIAYRDTILRAKEAFNQGIELGHPMNLLDIGGGFPSAHLQQEFIQIANTIMSTLDQHFDKNIQLIAEPGRFFAAPNYTLATMVIAKRSTINELGNPLKMYYLNEGVFKSFAEGAYIPSILYEPKLLTNYKSKSNIITTSSTSFESILWGPALGAADKINLESGLKLPELNIYDWLYFENMGSYSTCFNIEFNGFEQSQIFYVNTEPEATRLALRKCYY